MKLTHCKSPTPLASVSNSQPNNNGKQLHMNHSHHITNLTNLQFLNISNNQFSGHMDWNYSTMENLQVVDVYNNNFTYLLPLVLVSLKKSLKYLDLGGKFVLSFNI